MPPRHSKPPPGSTGSARPSCAACPFLAASHRGGIFVVPRGGGPNDLPPPHPSPRRAYCLDQSSNPSPSPVSRVVGSARRSRVTGRRFFTRAAHAAGQGGGWFSWFLRFLVFRVRFFAVAISICLTRKIYATVRTIARSIQKKSRGIFPATKTAHKIFLGRNFQFFRFGT